MGLWRDSGAHTSVRAPRRSLQYVLRAQKQAPVSPVPRDALSAPRPLGRGSEACHLIEKN